MESNITLLMVCLFIKEILRWMLGWFYHEYFWVLWPDILKLYSSTTISNHGGWFFCIFSAIDGGIPPLACHSLFALLGSYPHLCFRHRETAREHAVACYLGNKVVDFDAHYHICGCQATRWSLFRKEYYVVNAEIRQMSTTSFWHLRARK